MMTLKADVLPELGTPKKVFRWMSKKSRFRGPFDKQNGKRAQQLLQSGWQHVCHIYSSLLREYSSKMSVLVPCGNLRLFVSTLTADDKYFLLNRDNLTEPI